MKRIFNAILIIALLLTLVIPAFAKEPYDVQGTIYEDAVNKLLALGVVTGRGDGKYAPEESITRKEFAAMIVRVTGHDSDVKYLKYLQPFPDVAPGQWFTGYVAAAKAYGFIKGNADGTFSPDAPVKGSETLAVLLRALGYNDNLPSEWPYNYILKANALGMLDGVEFSAYGPVNRGVVAQLTSAILEQNVVFYDQELNVFYGEDSTNPNDQFIQARLGKNFINAVVNDPKLNENGRIKLDSTWKSFADYAYVD